MINITELWIMNIVPTRLNWSMVLGITNNVTVPGEFDYLQRFRAVGDHGQPVHDKIGSWRIQSQTGYSRSWRIRSQTTLSLANLIPNIPNVPDK